MGVHRGGHRTLLTAAPTCCLQSADACTAAKQECERVKAQLAFEHGRVEELMRTCGMYVCFRGRPSLSAHIRGAGRSTDANQSSASQAKLIQDERQVK